MARTEDDLWWYRGLRGSLTHLLDRYGKELSENPIVLDAGCGTGANLRCLSEHFKNAALSGFDINPTSLEYSRQKTPDLDIYQGDNISSGSKSIAFSVTLMPQDKTLSDNDIEQLSEKIISSIKESTGATLRS